jgi:hypothetical protein
MSTPFTKATAPDEQATPLASFWRSERFDSLRSDHCPGRLPTAPTRGPVAARLRSVKRKCSRRRDLKSSLRPIQKIERRPGRARISSRTSGMDAVGRALNGTIYKVWTCTPRVAMRREGDTGSYRHCPIWWAQMPLTQRRCLDMHGIDSTSQATRVTARGGLSGRQIEHRGFLDTGSTCASSIGRRLAVTRAGLCRGDVA